MPAWPPPCSRSGRPYAAPVAAQGHRRSEGGIGYFTNTFFAELPNLYIQTAEQFGIPLPRRRLVLPPFFRVGSWIGGDRDGNPFVTADILREACGSSRRRPSISTSRKSAMGGELPMSSLLVQVTPELTALAGHRRTNPQRADEPYRRAP